MRYACPCCGFLTLDDRGHYDICDVCFWEDDPIQSNDPSYWGGANEMSLCEAQASFKAIGAISASAKVYTRLPLPEEIPCQDS
jgi:hypothetical protein